MESREIKTFSKATLWVEGLNQTGYPNWKMPFTPDGRCGDWVYNAGVNSTKLDATCSDLGHLYYTVKINDSEDSAPPFPQHSFWLRTKKDEQISAHKNSEGKDMAWAFDFSTGVQFLQSLTSESYALAVRTEPLPKSPIPEPNTALLFLTGILCLTYRSLSRKQLR